MATQAGASILSITSGADPNLLVTASDERLLRCGAARCAVVGCSSCGA